MPDFTEMPGWVMTTGGGALLFFAYKFFWPAIRDSLSGQSAQWRSENRYIAQLEDARRQAEADKRAAEDRADSLFKELSTVQAKLTVMEFQMEAYKEQIERLKQRLDNIAGGRNA